MQNAAYERRISDGSSDVCSSDLQRQRIEAGAAFRLLAERHGAAEIGEVRRQQQTWMRDATRAMATGDMAVALRSYSDAGVVHAAGTRDAARAALIDRWDAERRCDPAASRIRSEEHTSELQSLMRISYAVFCL